MKRYHFPGLVVLAIACFSPVRMAMAEHVHDHPAHGPHGGELLELGADEYHAELVVVEKNDIVMIYVLDGTAKEEVAIEAPYLNVNVKLGRKPVQFRLAPVRAKGQLTGPTACFALESDDLMKAIHRADANPRLTMRIGKKAYVARLAHNHAHTHGESVQR